MRRTTLWLALALSVAACGSAVAETTTTSTTIATTTTRRPTTTTTAVTTTTLAGDLVPLTGLPAADSALLDRRVMAVKIDNAPAARPQSGLDVAEVVYELPVEAGVTRFIALFHSTDAAYLGPVRSARPTDPTLLLPLGATFTISGAQDWVIAGIRSAGIDLIGEGPGTFRIRSRRAPHNLYADTTALRGVADGRGYPDEPPAPMWQFGDLPAGSDKAETISIDFSDAVVAGWSWDGSRYVRTTNGVAHEVLAEDGTLSPLGVEVLVVLFADRYTASPPGEGTPVPAMDTVGSGRALVFAGGKVAEGGWSREKASEPFALSGEDGTPLSVPAGRSWISLVPTGRTVDW